MSWVGPALGIISTISGINAQKAQANAAKKAASSAAMSQQEQRDLINQLKPLIGSQLSGAEGLIPGISQLGKNALQTASSYDPAKEIAGAQRAYDQSLQRDVGNVRVPIGLRGLRSSSEDATQTGAVLNRRANDLANFNLTQPLRTQQVQAQGLGIGAPAFQTLNPSATIQGAAGILGGAAQTSANIGQNAYANASAINPFASLQGIDWKKFTLKS